MAQMFGTERFPLTGLGSAVDVAACQIVALSDAPSLVWVGVLLVCRHECGRNVCVQVGVPACCVQVGACVYVV
jgi:hypothetical protein